MMLEFMKRYLYVWVFLLAPLAMRAAAIVPLNEITQVTVTFESSETFEAALDAARTAAIADGTGHISFKVVMGEGVTGFSASDLTTLLNYSTGKWQGTGTVNGYDLSATDLTTLPSTCVLDYFSTVSLPSTITAIPSGAFRTGSNLLEANFNGA